MVDLDAVLGFHIGFRSVPGCFAASGLELAAKLAVHRFYFFLNEAGSWDLWDWSSTQALQSYKSSQVLEIASAVCTFWLQCLMSASIESHRKSGSAPKCPTILSSAWMFCYGWGYQVNLPPKRNGLGLTWVRLALRCLVQPLTCGMKSVLVRSSDCGCKTYLGGSTVLWQWVLKDQKKSSDVSMDSGCYI